MAKLGIGDEVTVTATVLKRVDDERVSVAIPSYNFPHSIRNTKARKGDRIELAGEVRRVDDETVTIGGEVGFLTVDAGTVRLVAKHRPPRQARLRDQPD
jgi:hypothetical protein